MNAIVIIFTLFLSYILWHLLKLTIWAWRAANMTANIPGPKPWPIIGNTPTFAHVTSLEDMFKIIQTVFKENSDPTYKITKLWLAHKLVIFLGHPKHIEIILSSEDCLEKDSMYEYIGLAGNGIMVRNGLEWQKLRKPLNKLLTKRMIESNIEMFHEKGLKLCKVLNKYIETGEDFNLIHYMTNYFFDTLCASNFGYDINEIDNDRINLAELTKIGIEMVMLMICRSPYNLSLTYTKMSMAGRRLTRLCRPFWSISNEILQARVKNKELQGVKTDEKPIYYSDVLIKVAEQDKLSWEDRGRLVSDFFIAGFHTSAVITSYTLLLLAIYKEHQEAVYQEQVDILGEDPEVIPSWEQLSKMTYLTRILKEVLRLFDAPAILRKVNNDVDLGDYKLPKGSTAYVLLYSLHRDPNFWSHPEEFYPDHFLPEEVANRPKGAYFPFSWGPRSCPGIQFAMISIKVLISTALRNYRFESDMKFEEFKYKYSLLLENS